MTQEWLLRETRSSRRCWTRDALKSKADLPRLRPCLGYISKYRSRTHVLSGFSLKQRIIVPDNTVFAEVLIVAAVILRHQHFLSKSRSHRPPPRFSTFWTSLWKTGIRKYMTYPPVEMTSSMSPRRTPSTLLSLSSTLARQVFINYNPLVIEIGSHAEVPERAETSTKD